MEELKKALREIKSTVKETSQTLTDFRIEMNGRVSKLEVKSGVWGFLGGLGAIAITMGLWYIKTSV